MRPLHAGRIFLDFQVKFAVHFCLISCESGEKAIQTSLHYLVSEFFPKGFIMHKSQILSFFAVIGCSVTLLSTQVHSQVGAAKSTLLLQGSTPGFSQSGHANMTGVLTADGGFVSNGTFGPALTANAAGSGIAALLNGNTLITGFNAVGPSFSSQIGAERMTIGDASNNTWEGVYALSGPTGLPFFGYYAAGAQIAYHYLDSSDSTWKLYVGGAYPILADSSGRLGIGSINQDYKFTAEGGRSTFFTNDPFRSTVEFRNGANPTYYSARIGIESWATGEGSDFDVASGAFRAVGGTSRNWGLNAEAYGNAGTTNYGIVANASGGTSYAGYFVGNNHTVGTLSATTKTFKIDHPLDPYNKYLNHSSIESDEMMNLYRGITKTDDDGYATVEVPNWFSALNENIQYQLTVVDEGDSDDFVMAKVVQKLENNKFRIRTNVPNVEVNWMLTGVRIDKSARFRPVVVEEEKPEQFKGKLLDPLAYGKTREAGELQPLAKKEGATSQSKPKHNSPVQPLKVKVK